MKIGVSCCVFLAFVSSSVANNSTYIPECMANDDCDADRVCAKQKCVNPCAAVCGANTVCHVVNHVAMCSCSPGHSGHPTIGCSRSDTTQCVTNDDCQADRVCAKQMCVNPCAAVCGANTVCHVVNHVAMCSCSPGHSGHPTIGCSPTPQTTSCSQNPSRRKKFFIEDSKKVDWHEALMNCLQNNSHLAAVETYEELIEIGQLIHETGKESSYWVSGSDHGFEGHFIWTTTGKPIPSDCNLWLPGQPNNGGRNYQNCVKLSESSNGQTFDGYGLNDKFCQGKDYFVCQYYV